MISSTPSDKNDVFDSKHRRHSSDERSAVSTKDIRGIRAEESSSSSLNSTYSKNSSIDIFQKIAVKDKNEETTKDKKKKIEKENVNDGTEIDGRTSILNSRITVNPANLLRKNSVSPPYPDLEDSLNRFAPVQSIDPGDNAIKMGSIKTPFFPRGKILKMEIYSTWGDGLYVGLNGLDIFDENGDLLSNNSNGKSSVLRIESDGKHLLSSPEFQNDPREVSNIVNGTNFTRNDLHVWLAPLGHLNDNENNVSNEQLIASISIYFKKSITISLIRVFNYNKSRTHCTRGVRHCVFKLDDVTIYDG